MANAPSYNPNIRTSFKTEVMRNRAITDTSSQVRLLNLLLF